jgi:hypothetical protein
VIAAALNGMELVQSVWGGYMETIQQIEAEAFNKALTVFHKLITETDRTHAFWNEFRVIREEYIQRLIALREDK